MNNLTLNPSFNTPADRSGDMYDLLLEGIRRSFDEVVSSRGAVQLFTTNVTDLYDVFLSNLPYEARQHYDCRTCRNFVNKYGSLVCIDDDGNLEPVMWNHSPEFFASAVNSIRERVRKSKVTGVFITDEKRLGIPKTGVWTHFAVDVPKYMIYHNRLKSPFQASAEKHEDFKMVQNAVSEYSIETVEAAVNLLRSDSMYRGEKILGIAEWFLDILKTVKNNPKRSNIIWKKVATAPAGFCHISSSMIGTLLDDIRDGLDIDVVRYRFNEKMDPLHYQRPKVAPSSGNVARAEKIVAELGLENSLTRRFARLDEIETIWKPSDMTDESTSSGVFAGVKTKDEPKKKSNYNTNDSHHTTMTWEKFRRTVLPTAKKIELSNFYGRNTFAALVTAEDFNAPPIIMWDSEERRNPFSWYTYANGSTAYGWNLKYGVYVEVTGITLQPNLWQPGYEHLGQGVFFILKGCKDTMNTSSGLFPELLRGELREVRSTIEAYSKQHKLGGYGEASACGLLLQSGTGAWSCTLRVTTDVGVNLYKLDRWD